MYLALFLSLFFFFSFNGPVRSVSILWIISKRQLLIGVPLICLVRNFIDFCSYALVNSDLFSQGILKWVPQA